MDIGRKLFVVAIILAFTFIFTNNNSSTEQNPQIDHLANKNEEININEEKGGVEEEINKVKNKDENLDIKNNEEINNQEENSEIILKENNTEREPKENTIIIVESDDISNVEENTEKEDKHEKIENKNSEEIEIVESVDDIDSLQVGDKTIDVEEIKEEVSLKDKIEGLKLVAKLDIPYIMSLIKDGVTEDSTKLIKEHMKEKLSAEEYEKAKNLSLKYLLKNN